MFQVLKHTAFGICVYFVHISDIFDCNEEVLH